MMYENVCNHRDHDMTIDILGFPSFVVPNQEAMMEIASGMGFTVVPRKINTYSAGQAEPPATTQI